MIENVDVHAILIFEKFQKIIFEKFSPGGSLIWYALCMFHRCSLILWIIITSISFKRISAWFKITGFNSFVRSFRDLESWMWMRWKLVIGFWQRGHGMQKLLKDIGLLEEIKTASCHQDWFSIRNSRISWVPFVYSRFFSRAKRHSEFLWLRVVLSWYELIEMDSIDSNTKPCETSYVYPL